MNINWTNNYKLASELTILILPKTMVATMKESCMRQIGMTVKSFDTVIGSFEVAIVAPAPPTHKVANTNASFFQVCHRARVAIFTFHSSLSLSLSLVGQIITYIYVVLPKFKLLIFGLKVNTLPTWG